MSDFPLSLCAEKAFLVVNRGKTVKKWPKIILVILVLLLAGVGTYLFINKDNKQEKKKETKKVEKKEEKKAVDYEAKVFMVGDALIHWGVYNDAQQADGSCGGHR